MDTATTTGKDAAKKFGEKYRKKLMETAKKNKQ